MIVSNLKMINKMSTFPPGKFLRTPMNDRAFSLSFFRAFTHYELFISFRSLNFSCKINNQSACYYFIKITCNNKCYAPITMDVADYSKQQLKVPHFKSTDLNRIQVSIPVVPNRGAIYSAQGCRGLTRFFTISLKIHFQTVIKPQSKLLCVP